MEGSCRFLTLDEIIDVNALMLSMAGEDDNFIGEDNLRYPDALKYILEATQSLSFGRDLYPTIIEKAGAIGWQISASHVFWEGNKRTGMEVCRAFLELNGYEMSMDWDVYRMGMSVAKSEVDRETFIQWVSDRTSPIIDLPIESPPSEFL